MAKSGVLNVYIEEPSPRTEWIFRLILEELLGLEVVFVDEATAGRPCLNYSWKDLDAAVQITPYGLLSESGIRLHQIQMGEHKGIPVFFMTRGGDMPFDPFSMSFYLVSRYEEYLPFQADVHGRFPHTESLAFKKNFLHLPVVNHCALWIGKLLEEKYPSLNTSPSVYSFQPTIDVDQAFAHTGLGFTRSWGGMAKFLLKGKIQEAVERIRCMSGKQKDPFDNFGILSDLFSAHNLVPIYFILAGKPGKHDRNLLLKNEKFIHLIQHLSENATIAVHPSYASGNSVEKIKEEISGLENVCGKKVSCSRQHFVKMTLPGTYEAIMQAGITDDYSMGFASISGFRAGIASPFNFYNLEKEEARPLRIHPFMFMDSTLGDYMNLVPQDYFNAVLPFIDEVKSVGGQLSGIWHNYDLADDSSKHEALKRIVEKAIG